MARYAAYAVSFMTIGIIWINHHAMINRLRDADHTILILNLLLLMSIGILPFATDLMATYLRTPTGEHAGRGDLRRRASADVADVRRAEPAHPARRRTCWPSEMPLAATAPDPRRARHRADPYAVAVALRRLSAYLTLVICAAVAVFYALPLASGTRASAHERQTKERRGVSLPCAAMVELREQSSASSRALLGPRRSCSAATRAST